MGLKNTAIVGVVALLCTSVTPAQMQPSVSGSDIPDAAAWRIWLNQKGEAPGEHTEAFKSYLVSLRLSQQDSAVLQAVLESYAEQENALRTAINSKIEVADENLDEATAATLQTGFQAKLAALVTTAQTQLASQLTANGAGFLSDFIQNEKRHMTISPFDASLAQSKAVIRAEPAAYHSHGAPQGTQMGFGYGTYASTWLSVAGFNSNGLPYGTFYQQIGAQGTTSPCTGQCLTAYHSAVTEYNHGGGGTQTYTVANQRANTALNGSYSYSWPFDASNNFYWGAETAWVYLRCTIAGIFLQNNPAAPASDPFQSEAATTFTTTKGQAPFTCTNQGGCNVNLTRSGGTLLTYCSTLYPDYVPTSLSFSLYYGTTILQFLQESPCWRTGSGSPWNCNQAGGYNDPSYSPYTLKPPAGGAVCTSHHP